MEHKEAIDLLEKHMHVLQNAPDDYTPLLNYIGNASLVLLGEATHGTHEFYEARAQITKRLIQEKGFTQIAIEGDWPDAYRVNQYIHQRTATSAVHALSDFKRFPAWMWRNAEMVHFIEWLRIHNTNVRENHKVGFYGLDLYSLHRSMELVVTELEKFDQVSAQKARERYACFDAFPDPQYYGHHATLYPNDSCRQAVLDQLVALQKKELDFYRECAMPARECQLYIEQNALVVANAEHYYRSLFEGHRAASWNIRDAHMAQTVDALLKFGVRGNESPKIVIWAHNSHLGNASATQMASFGEINVGQLLKERYGAKVVSVGFSTYHGTVSAASNWGSAVERKIVRPALQGSYEALFHELPFEKVVLFTHDDERIKQLLAPERLQRAIGVIYLPERERASHYFYASLPAQFDVMIHFDTTHALEPLDKSAEWEQGELPETYPFGT
ncbi:MAG: erythromycin esterase family protein [Candidatus Babeliales bacterium]